MAQTLDPVLAAAQEGIDRRPLVRITSDTLTTEIPFPGIPMEPNPVTTSPPQGGFPWAGFEEQFPSAITLSDGEALYTSIYGETLMAPIPGDYSRHVKIVTTKNNRTEFNEPILIELNRLYPGGWYPERYLIPTFVGQTFDPRVSSVELANGNIGLIWMDEYHLLGHWDVLIHAAELTRAGVKVWPSGAIWSSSTLETYADDAIYYWSGPTTIRLANGSILAVFAHHSSGGGYRLWKKTTTDFRTFTARSEIVLSGVPTTKQVSNPFLKQLSNGNVMLFFDLTDSVGANGDRLRNLYYIVSTDNGATWGAPQKVTNYSQYSSIAMHPEVFQRTANQITMVFTELLRVLNLKQGSVGWTTGDDGESLSWDPVNRKLYVLNTQAGFGGGALQGVLKIDVDTWSIEREWDETTTPGFPPLSGGWDCVTHYRHLIAVRHDKGVSVLDGEANTITDYNFDDNPAEGIVKNVNGWDYFNVTGAVRQIPLFFVIEGPSMRLYFMTSDTYPGRRQLGVGYIDLTDPGPEYGAVKVFYEDYFDLISHYELAGIDMHVISTSLDMVIIPFMGWFGTIQGGVLIYQLSTGGFMKVWKWDNNNRFPYLGINDPVVRGDKIYGGITYTTMFGNGDKRGVVELDPLTGICTYFRPSYATQDDYPLHTPHVLSTGEILWAGWGDGVVLWNPDTSEWTQFTMATLPGLPTNSWPGTIDIDETTGMIFVNGMYAPGVWAFSRTGYLYRSKRVDANFTTGWDWGDPEILTQKYKSYGATPAYLPSDDSMLLFWQEATDYGARDVLWGNEVGELDATDFLARGHDITLARSIDGKPSSVEFTCIHGHLFDPTNRGSIWQGFFKKGRKVTLSFGELISGIGYWVNQGSFIVTETEVNHRRGDYPTIRVKAEDIRVLWEGMEIAATPNYQTTPEEIVRIVLHDFMGMDYSDIVLGTFRWSYEVWIQWLDSTIKKMLEQIGNRFGYALIVDPAGRVVAKKIARDNPVDHIYSDVSKIMDWTPDDSFSDLTNRVTVHGETRDFQEVMYEEELIKSMTGTIGFWGGKQTFTVYFSEDSSRTCRYPRLNVIESVRNFNFRLGGGGESISYIDPGGKHIVVTIEMPDLTGFIIADCAALLALGVAAIYAGGLVGCPGWIVAAITVLLAGLFFVVGSIAQYQYEIYARPVGLERLSIQSSPPRGDDLILQNELGRVVEKKIDEPLCITVAQCNDYADYELDICRLQRNRIRFSKIAHLQDDEADTIQIPQPFSGATTKIFVTDIKRKMKIPAEPDSMDGYFKDEIEGWVLT